jgi:hypothetical protein
VHASAAIRHLALQLARCIGDAIAPNAIIWNCAHKLHSTSLARASHLSDEIAHIHPPSIVAFLNAVTFFGLTLPPSNAQILLKFALPWVERVDEILLIQTKVGISKQIFF